MAQRPSLSLEVIRELLFRHWGSKIAALLLAGVVFVSTRDEVTRAFEIPLRVVQDPNRVLLTDLPNTVQVHVRGPWTRVNRLQDYDLGVATLDLEEASPGPLEIDEGSVVMPPGVVLAGIQYDHVDLRFEPVIQREIEVIPAIVGQPGEDYQLVRIEAEPPRWPVRGGRSQVQELGQLTTEPLDLAQATETVVAELELVRPRDHVRLEQEDGAQARVTVRAVIEPLIETTEFTVPVVVPEKLDPSGAVPPTYQVRVSGPVPALRELEALGLAFPIEAEVVPIAEPNLDAGRTVEVRFEWAQGVPDALRNALTFDHGVVRVMLPPEAPEPGTPEPGAPTPDI